jgi:hypothetical protein
MEKEVKSAYDDSNRMSKLLKKLEEEDKEKVKKLDIKKIKEGFKFRITVWVHPETLGDDYQVDCYSKLFPKSEDVDKFLKQKGWNIPDYEVFSLEELYKI